MANIEHIIESRLSELTARYPELALVREDIKKAYLILKDCYDKGGKLMIAGNGGSCSDAQHIVGELMKGFCKRRELPTELKDKMDGYQASMEGCFPEGMGPVSDKLQLSLQAIALSDHQSLNTAFANDVSSELCFAQQVMGYGRKGDVLLLISTSGNSRNLLYTIPVAKALGIKVLALTGKDGGRLAGLSDAAIIAPQQETYKIQELHLPIYHCLCLMLEDTYFEA